MDMSKTPKEDDQYVDNTEIPLRYHRGNSVVVFQYYQQKSVTPRTRVRIPIQRTNSSMLSSRTSYGSTTLLPRTEICACPTKYARTEGLQKGVPTG